MIRILNAEPDHYSPEARALLLALGELVEVPCDRSQLLELIPDFDVLIVRLAHRVDRQLLSQGGRLKAVVTATTGLDHIDLEAAQQLEIQVLSLKGEYGFLRSLTATAEHSWGLLLGLIRHLPAAHGSVLSGTWERDRFRGTQLRGKSLGLLGFGRLGRQVADYGRAFRMTVRAHDPGVQDYPEWVHPVSFEQLLESSDVLSLHLNLDATTRGILDRNAFSHIKPGAVLINTSRGELIDEVALLDALESGRLAGAALDVLNGEVGNPAGWLQNSPLWQYARTHGNLLLTPHLGGATWETMAETECFMARKLAGFLGASH